MGFAVYKKRCDIIYIGYDSEYLFSHSFITMECNLMERSDNYVKFCINRVQWKDDCLIFFFGMSKQNQTGYASDITWNVYSDPNSSPILPLRDLTKYPFTHPYLLWYVLSLFTGTSQYDQFIKVFHKLLFIHRDNFESLGVKPGKISYHFNIKG